MSPSSVNPYLFPSKQIPDEYLTTTEPVNHMDTPHNNIKTFTLAGFSFNDLDDHEVSASNRVEGSRVQVIEQNFEETLMTRNVLLHFHIGFCSR